MARTGRTWGYTGPVHSQEVTVRARGEEHPIYTGAIQEIYAREENGVHQARLELASATVWMDLEKKDHSYQDTGMSYGALIGQVCRQAKAAGSWPSGLDGTPIGVPQIQYQETDWEFLKRMASHWGLPLYAQEGPGVRVGVPERGEGPPLDWSEYMAVLDKGYYQLRSLGYVRDQLRSYEVESLENRQVGERTEFQGRKLTILEKRCESRGGSLAFRYRLGLPECAGTRRESYDTAGLVVRVIAGGVVVCGATIATGGIAAAAGASAATGTAMMSAAAMTGGLAVAGMAATDYVSGRLSSYESYMKTALSGSVVGAMTGAAAYAPVSGGLAHGALDLGTGMAGDALMQLAMTEKVDGEQMFYSGMVSVLLGAVVRRDAVVEEGGSAAEGAVRKNNAQKIKGAKVNKERSGTPIHNDVLDSPRTGSALTVDEVRPIYEINPKTGRQQIVKEFPATAQAHGFNDIVDNYAGYATKTSLGNADLYQLEGSLNGVPIKP